MGLRKKNKISAEFSMSSLTDIIFLLLIFFMLTSNLVSPNALFLKMPGKSTPSVSDVNPPDITIKRNGTFLLDGSPKTLSELRKSIRTLKKSNGGKKLDVTISPVKNCPIQYVVTIMDMANIMKINGILALDN